MNTPRFFCPVPTSAGAVFELPDAVAHHAVQVLRLKSGDQITLFDGAGGEYLALIASTTRNRATVSIGEYSQPARESNLELVLAQALTSNEKMDWLVQKAVELGVSRVVPLLMERSVVRLSGERAEKRVKHLQQVAIAACEQCGRNVVPHIAPLQDLPGWLAESGGIRLALSPGGVPLAQVPLGAGTVTVLVGPEGGFSEVEERLLQQQGCTSISLGPRVLRTETAGLAALAALQALYGDWR